MTTSEKAQKLVDKFKGCFSGNEQTLENAKKAAIIAVEEILQNFDGLNKPEYCAFDADPERKFTWEHAEYDDWMTGYDMIDYWEDVKIKIESCK